MCTCRKLAAPPLHDDIRGHVYTESTVAHHSIIFATLGSSDGAPDRSAITRRQIRCFLLPSRVLRGHRCHILVCSQSPPTASSARTHVCCFCRRLRLQIEQGLSDDELVPRDEQNSSRLTVHRDHRRIQTVMSRSTTTGYTDCHESRTVASDVRSTRSAVLGVVQCGC